MLEPIAEALRNVNLDVDVVEGTLNVTHGRGPMARKVNIDPTALIERLEEASDRERRRDLAAYARGVQMVLLEPKRSKARSWSFVESTGSIFPTIEADAYRLGVFDATGGEEAWCQPLDDELIVAWTMRLDHGMRPVTAPQFDDWGVTADRVKAAGRSLLFHSTRNTDWRQDDWAAPVRALRVGDGFDAARVLVVEDVFFSDVDRQWRFAMPDPDLLLAVPSNDDVGTLAEEAQRWLERTDAPLSSRVWSIHKGTPRPTDT